MRFAVASKEAGFGLEKNVELLALVSVSVSASVELPKFCGRSVDALVPRSGQRYDRASGAMEAYTLLLSGILLVGGEGGACAL